jgi:hypothetical protein
MEITHAAQDAYCRILSNAKIHHAVMLEYLAQKINKSKRRRHRRIRVAKEQKHDTLDPFNNQKG